MMLAAVVVVVQVRCHVAGEQAGFDPNLVAGCAGTSSRLLLADTVCADGCAVLWCVARCAGCSWALQVPRWRSAVAKALLHCCWCCTLWCARRAWRQISTKRPRGADPAWQCLQVRDCLVNRLRSRTQNCLHDRVEVQQGARMRLAWTMTAKYCCAPCAAASYAAAQGF
jgi:hypothetical protein